MALWTPQSNQIQMHLGPVRTPLLQPPILTSHLRQSFLPKTAQLAPCGPRSRNKAYSPPPRVYIHKHTRLNSPQPQSRRSRSPHRGSKARVSRGRAPAAASSQGRAGIFENRFTPTRLPHGKWVICARARVARFTG